MGLEDQSALPVAWGWSLVRWVWWVIFGGSFVDSSHVVVSRAREIPSPLGEGVCPPFSLLCIGVGLLLSVLKKEEKKIKVRHYVILCHGVVTP